MYKPMFGKGAISSKDPISKCGTIKIWERGAILLRCNHVSQDGFYPTSAAPTWLTEASHAVWGPLACPASSEPGVCSGDVGERERGA